MKHDACYMREMYSVSCPNEEILFFVSLKEFLLISKIVTQILVYV